MEEFYEVNVQKLKMKYKIFRMVRRRRRRLRWSYIIEETWLAVIR